MVLVLFLYGIAGVPRNVGHLLVMLMVSGFGHLMDDRLVPFFSGMHNGFDRNLRVVTSVIRYPIVKLLLAMKV